MQRFFPQVRLFMLRIWSPVGSMGSEASAEWGPDTWITCEECGWGAQGGIDHVEVDDLPSQENPARNLILCRWCFDIPKPPFWTTFPNTRHYLNRMKVLPEDLRDTPSVDLIADFLISYGRWPTADNDVLSGVVRPP